MKLNFIKITDFNQSELDIYARLSENELLHYYEPNGGLFIAESGKVIMRALAAGYEPVSMLVCEEENSAEKQELFEYIMEMGCERASLDVFTAPLIVLEQLIGYKLTRGLLCAMKRKTLPSIEEICEKAERIAVLENVQNPTNMGAIFRSAAALSMEAVIITDKSCDPLYRRSSRVSMGCVFQVPFTIVSEEDYMDRLKSLGFKSVAMALKDESLGLRDERLKNEKKLAIIMGSEGYGLSEKTIDKADYTVMLKMTNGVDSLNVAAASAVAFWELGKNE